MSREIKESYSWEEVPPYGKVRTLVQQVLINGEPAGDPISVFDLTFQPELPAGALRGEPDRCAPFCNYCNAPKYFYLDQAVVCSECEADFVFTASEQKYWFEELKVHIRTRCIRCRKCRKKRWTRKSAQKKLQFALSDLQADPGNELLHLNAAQAFVEHYTACGEGSLEKAVHHARQARSTSEIYPEAHYWEARAHFLAGRKERASDSYSVFQEVSKGSPHLRCLREAGLD